MSRKVSRTGLAREWRDLKYGQKPILYSEKRCLELVENGWDTDVSRAKGLGKGKTGVIPLGKAGHVLLTCVLMSISPPGAGLLAHLIQPVWNLS
jgi:hypothetical protein